MLKGLRKVSFAVKPAVFSLLLAAGIAAIAAAPYQALVRANADLQDLASSVPSKQAAAQALSRRLAQLHLDLFRLADELAEQTSSANFADRRQAVLDGAQRIEAQLRALQSRTDLSSAERGDLDAAGAAWTYYHRVISGPASAEAALSTSKLDDGLRDVERRFAKIADDWSGASKAALDELTRAGAASIRVFEWTGGVVVLWTLGLALVASRSYVRPFWDIVNAMLAVAAGRRAELPGGKRRGELGQMMEAVTAFGHQIKAQEGAASQRERDLAVQSIRFEAAVNQMAHGLAMFDANHNLIVCNEAYLGIYGLNQDEIRPGAHLRDILAARAAVGTGSTCGGEVAGFEAASERRAWRRLDTLRNGRIVAVSHQPIADGASVSTHEDVTEQRRADAHIEHLARHDPLTNLPNRAVFRDELDKLLAHATRWNSVAVLSLDLDNFKTVNDSLGHPVGDGLLRSVAERLRDSIPRRDLVARLGGDEFAIIHRSSDRLQSLPPLAERIIAALSQPFLIDGHPISIGTSVGISCAPDDGSDPDLLIKNADMALYRAKKEKRGTFRRFESEMAEQEQARRDLEVELREAVAGNQFELYYQPLHDAKTEAISGFEALIRWNHPERGLIPPIRFIPLAEEIGLIVPLGEWIIREVCAQAAKWPSNHRVAVNLSPLQITAPSLVPTVINALASSGLPGPRLELEITESVFLSNAEATLNALKRLKQLGVRIAMDDFGTGYSSLNYLRCFPFDKIKIDRSFIQDLGIRHDCHAIVQAVITLGAKLGMTTTAEGVETREQFLQLRELGVTDIQGYLFGRPMPLNDLGRLLANTRAAA